MKTRLKREQFAPTRVASLCRPRAGQRIGRAQGCHVIFLRAANSPKATDNTCPKLRHLASNRNRCGRRRSGRADRVPGVNGRLHSLRNSRPVRRSVEDSQTRPSPRRARLYRRRHALGRCRNAIRLRRVTKRRGALRSQAFRGPCDSKEQERITRNALEPKPVARWSKRSNRPRRPSPGRVECRRRE